MGNQIVLKKLVNAMGPKKGQSVMNEIMSQIGLDELKTADQRFKFGLALIGRGGVGKLLGQSITMQARLHGAHG